MVRRVFIGLFLTALWFIPTRVEAGLANFYIGLMTECDRPFVSGFSTATLTFDDPPYYQLLFQGKPMSTTGTRAELDLVVITVWHDVNWSVGAGAGGIDVMGAVNFVYAHFDPVDQCGILWNPDAFRSR